QGAILVGEYLKIRRAHCFTAEEASRDVKEIVPLGFDDLAYNSTKQYAHGDAPAESTKGLCSRDTVRFWHQP
ncbi:MAG: hypothetical protein M3434_08735, partial [Gemmatimonadota bacterium]|nr:hypothetical protein [Gemmatimonadota bacterium]